MRILRSLADFLVTLLLWALAPFAGRRRPPQGLPERVGSVLLIRVDERVGNVLLTTPLFAPLMERFPEAKIDFLLARSKLDLVSGLVHPVPFEKKDFFRHPWRFLRGLWRLRSAQYDIAIDASHWHTFSATSALLLAWTGAKIRVAHERGPARLAATDLVPPPLPSSEAPEVPAKLRLLAPLGITATEGRMATKIGTEPEIRARIDSWLEAHRFGPKPLVALSPGGRKPLHRLPAGLFGEIGLTARELGAEVIVLWGPGEESLAQEVAAMAGVQLAPPTNLQELAALMRRCQVVVTNDTGPMHLSVAVATPTIALFAQPAERRWGHRYLPHAVIPAAGRVMADVAAEAKAALAQVLSTERHA